MTQLRRDPNNISNYFDRLYDGVGHRGSTFSDLDAITHDMTSNRFLVQEFKREGEDLNHGQKSMLRGLAKIPGHFTVWLVRLRGDGQHDWANASDIAGTKCVLSGEELRGRFKQWWDGGTTQITARAQQPADPDISAFCDAIEVEAVRKAG